MPEKVTAPAIHYTALQTSYKADGDQSGAAELKDVSKTTLRLILTGVDVATRTSPGAVVALGSSTTDGAHSSMDKNKRWTDDLFVRLEAADGAKAPGVLNSGIAGNRVLHDGRGSWGAVFGEAGMKRFDRDVLAQSGLKYVIVYEGGNDIRMPGHGGVPIEELVSPEQMIGAFQIMAKKSHEHKLKFYAATIAPSQNGDGTPGDPGWEKTRATFNAWVRANTDIDGFVDFDAATRDPEHPTRLLPKFDSGDHLHPNDLGYASDGRRVRSHTFSVAAKAAIQEQYYESLHNEPERPQEHDAWALPCRKHGSYRLQRGLWRELGRGEADLGRSHGRWGTRG